MVENDHLPQFLDEGKSIRFLVWRCFHAVSGGGLIQLIQNLQISITKIQSLLCMSKAHSEPLDFKRLQILQMLHTEYRDTVGGQNQINQSVGMVNHFENH